MSAIWRENIRKVRQLIQDNQGPEVVNVVSGSPSDRVYWQDRLTRTRQDVFREDSKTTVLSTLEARRKGNFLGSLNAWLEVESALGGKPLPRMTLMNMV